MKNLPLTIIKIPQGLVDNLMQSLTLLHLSQFPILNLIFSCSSLTISEVDYKSPTTFIYVLLNPFRNKVYVGESGGKNNPRIPLQRFFEHLQAAKKQGLSRSPIWKNGLYKHIKEDGLASWILIPVQITTPLRRLQDESHWIKLLPSVYNYYKAWTPLRHTCKEISFKIYSHDAKNR